MPPRTKERSDRKAPLSLREQQKLFTRARLLESATELFDTRGYVDTSVDDIVRLAGTSRATFYAHFSSKADMIDELWLATRVGIVDLFNELGSQDVVTDEWLALWLSRTFDFYVDNRAHLIAIHQAIAIEPSLAERFNARVDEVESSLVDRIQRSRGVSHEEAHLRASLLVMQHERFCHFWLLRGIEFDRDLATSVLSSVWHGELAPA